MPHATKRPPQFQNMGEVLEQLGNIPARRVRLDPAPGTATKRDLLRLHGRANRLYELVDGTLVEKAMGHPEAHVGMELGYHLRTYLEHHPVGFIAGADALIEVLPKLVRGPDVSIVSWAKQPDRKVPRDPISKLIPDLAVEVLSPGNTRGEILRKLKEYFLAGVAVVWVIDPDKARADVYTAPDAKVSVDASGTLDGGDLLPGLRVPLAKLFEQLAPPAPRKKPKRK